MLRVLLCSVVLGAAAACGGEVASCEVVSSAGQELHVTLTGSRVEIRAGAQHLFAETRADKRAYHEGTPDGPVVLEVKNAESGFKLETVASELLWKVRFEENKIKVSDNVENDRAWTIRLEPGGEGKIRAPDQQVVGRVVAAPSTGLPVVNEASGQQAFAVRSGPASIGYGVLLMRGVPERERQVIVAELIARGR